MTDTFSYNQLKSFLLALTFVGITIHISLFYFVYLLERYRFPLSIKKEIALKDLGFYQEEKRLENEKKKNIRAIRAPIVKITEKSITIDTPNFALSLDKVIANKDALESIFNCTISEISRLPHASNNVFVFNKAMFDSLDADKVPELKAFELYLGLDSKGNIIQIDLEKEFSTYIAAKSGKGKTTLIKNYIHILKAATPNLKVVIFDAKILDYDEDFIKEYDITFFPMNTLQDIKNANSYFEELTSKKNRDAVVLRDQKVSHAERLHEKNITLELSRHFIIFDEAGRYLKATGSKEMKEEKQKLISHATDTLALLRAHSCSIMISTQRMHADELDIPYENFTSFILSTVGKEMSDKYADGFARDNKTGQWYVRGDKFSGLIKVPFSLNIKNVQPGVVVNSAIFFSKRHDFPKLMDDVFAITHASDECAHIMRNNSTDVLTDNDFEELLKYLATHDMKRDAYTLRCLRPHVMSLLQINEYSTVKDNTNSIDGNPSIETESHAGSVTLVHQREMKTVNKLAHFRKNKQ